MMTSVIKRHRPAFLTKRCLCKKGYKGFDLSTFTSRGRLSTFLTHPLFFGQHSPCRLILAFYLRGVDV